MSINKLVAAVNKLVRFEADDSICIEKTENYRISLSNIRKNNRRNKRTDITVHLHEMSEINIAELQKELGTFKPSIFSNWDLEHNVLTITLNRSIVFASVLRQINENDERYGFPILSQHVVLAESTNTCQNNDSTSMRIQTFQRQIDSLLQHCGTETKDKTESSECEIVKVYIGSDKQIDSSMEQESESSDKERYCTVGSVCLRNETNDANIGDLIQKITDLVETSSRQRYESYNDEVDWKQTVKPIVDACIKMKFLGSAVWNPLTISINGIDNGYIRPPCFILYNYSRLQTLLSEFDRRVEANIYAPLPSSSLLDLSLLKQEHEWKLMLFYVAGFPHLIEEIMLPIVCEHSSKQNIKISLHKIVLFLLNLSNDVSSYYSAVRILVDSTPQLMQVLYCRITLLKAIHRIMLTSLQILTITPVNYM